MTYEQVKLVLTDIPEPATNRARRKAWSGTGRGFIFVDKGMLFEATPDWPKPYWPTAEDTEADDWIVT